MAEASEWDNDVKTAIRKQLHVVPGQRWGRGRGFPPLPSRGLGAVKTASRTHILKTGQDGMATPGDIAEVSSGS